MQLLDEIFKVTKYLDLYDPKDEEDLMRLENIKELRSVAREFPKLAEFLENVSLVEQEHLPDRPVSDVKRDAVSLMTLHAVKGLEFPVVFIVGMEEGLWDKIKQEIEAKKQKNHQLKLVIEQQKTNCMNLAKALNASILLDCSMNAS